MIGKNLQKHHTEFCGYIDRHQYEIAPEGLYVPKARTMLRGTYISSVNGEDERIDHNIIPTEGLNHFLSVCLKSGSQITAWYLALYSGAYTPLATLTAATFTSLTTEIDNSNAAEKYSEATRVAWVGDAVDTTNAEVTNTASPAAFTIVTASALVVNGAGMLSASAKASTAGTLMSAVRFVAARSLANTDVFNLKYKVDAD